MPADDAFIEKIKSFFEENRIRILDLKVKRKNSEANMVVSIPSVIGDLRFACKAKNKKRITDADLSTAQLYAEQNKLPLLFITTGELTKKARVVLDEHFKGLKVKVI